MTRAKKLIIVGLRYGLVAAIMWFIGRFLWMDRIEIGAYFQQAGAVFYGSIAVLSAFLYVQAWIWSGLLNTPARQLPIFRGAMIYVNSQFAKYLPGAIWNLVGRMIMAGRYGASLTAQVSSIYYENVLLVSVTLIYGLILFVKLGIVNGSAFIVLYMIVLAIYVYYDFLGQWVERTLHRYTSKLTFVKLGFPRKAFFASLLYYLASHLLMGFAFWLLLRSFGVTRIDVVEAAGIFAVAWLLGLVSPLPGGLGLREGALAFLLALQLDWELAYRIAIIARLWTLLAEIVIFGILNTADYIGKRVRLTWPSN